MLRDTVPHSPRQRHTSRGFTLVELSVAALVVLILASIAVVAFTTTRDRGEVSSIDTSLRNIEQVARASAEAAPAGVQRDPRTHLVAAAESVDIPQAEIDATTADLPVVDAGRGLVYMRRYDQCRVAVLDLTVDADGNSTLGRVGDPFTDLLIDTDGDGTADQTVADNVGGTFVCEPGNFFPPGTNEPAAPDGPPTVTATPVATQPDQVQVTWTEPASSTAISGYELWVDPDGDSADGDRGALFRITGPTAADRSVIVPGLDPNHANDYLFSVIAVNNQGRATSGGVDQWGDDTALPDADGSTLTAPDPVLATASDSTLAWNWPTNPPSEHIDGYEWTLEDSSGTVVDTGTTSVPSTVTTGLDNGATYTLIVDAVRGTERATGTGTGTPTAASVVLPPKSIRATAGAADINVDWEPSDTPSASYLVQWTTDGSGWPAVGTRTLAEGAAAADLTETHPGVTVGTTYLYRVFAYLDVNGNGTFDSLSEPRSDWTGPADARVLDDGNAAGGQNVVAWVTANDDTATSDGPGDPAYANAETVISGDDGKTDTHRGEPVHNEIEATFDINAVDPFVAVRVFLNGTRVTPIDDLSGDFQPGVRKVVFRDVPDGVYVVQVTTVDEFGNVAEPYATSGELLIDTTPPPLPLDRVLVDVTEQPSRCDNGVPPLASVRDGVEDFSGCTALDPTLPAHDLRLMWRIGPQFDLTNATIDIWRQVNGGPWMLYESVPTEASQPAVPDVIYDNDGTPTEHVSDDPVWNDTGVGDKTADRTIPVGFQDSQVLWGSDYCYRIQLRDSYTVAPPSPDAGTYTNLSDWGYFDAENDPSDGMIGLAGTSCRTPIDDNAPEPAPDSTLTEWHRRLDVDWIRSFDGTRGSGRDDYEIDRRRDVNPWQDAWFSTPSDDEDLTDGDYQYDNAADAPGDKPWLSEWCYRVNATDQAGNATAGSVACGIALDTFAPTSPGAPAPAEPGYQDYPLNPDGHVPAAAGSHTPTDINRGIRIDWADAADDYSGVQGYWIQRRSNGGTEPAYGWVDLDTFVSPPTFTDRSWHTATIGDSGASGLRWGTEYCYQVRSMDHAGDHPRYGPGDAPAGVAQTGAGHPQGGGDNLSVWTGEDCGTPDDTGAPAVDVEVTTTLTQMTWTATASDDFSGLDTVTVDYSCTGYWYTDVPRSSDTDGDGEADLFWVERTRRDTTVTGNLATEAGLEAPGYPGAGWSDGGVIALPVTQDFHRWDCTVDGDAADYAGNTASDTDTDRFDRPAVTPTGMRVDSLEKAVRVRWDPASVTDGVFRCYQLQFREQAHTTPSFTPAGLNTTWRNVPGAGCIGDQTTTGLIHGGPSTNPGALPADRDYDYRIRVRQNDGTDTAWSNQPHAEPWARPQPVKATNTNMEATAGADTGARITWPAAVDEDRDLSTYRVYRQQADCTNTNVNVGDGSLVSTQAGRTFNEAVNANRWYYYYAIPADSAGHRALPWRDRALSNGGAGSNWHDRFCAVEAGYHVPNADTTEAYYPRVDADAPSGITPSTVDLFHRQAAVGSACRAADLWINDGQHDTVYRDGPLPGGSSWVYCQQSTDRYGNVGPMSPSRPVSVNDVYPVLGGADAQPGVAENGGATTGARILGASWTPANGASYYIYRWVATEPGPNPAASPPWVPAPSGYVTGWRTTTATAGVNSSVGMIPYDLRLALEVRPCHEARDGNPGTATTLTGAGQDCGETAMAGLSDGVTLTYSRNYRVAAPIDEVAHGSCMVVPAGKEWRDVGFCLSDPGGMPSTVGQSLWAHYDATNGRPAARGTHTAGFGAANTHWRACSDIFGAAIRSDWMPDGRMVCTDGDRHFGNFAPNGVHYDTSDANPGRRRLPTYRNDGNPTADWNALAASPPFVTRTYATSVYGGSVTSVEYDLVVRCFEQLGYNNPTASTQTGTHPQNGEAASTTRTVGAWPEVEWAEDPIMGYPNRPAGARCPAPDWVPNGQWGVAPVGTNAGVNPWGS